MSNNLQSLLDLLFNHADLEHSDDVLISMVEKISSVLSTDEIEILNEVTEKLHDAKTSDEFVDRYPEVTSDDLNNVFKRYIWDNSDDWADEMFSVSDGIMTNLNMLESDAIKQLIIELNKKDA